MKRLGIPLIAVAMAATIAACGSGTSGTAAATATTSSQTTSASATGGATGGQTSASASASGQASVSAHALAIRARGILDRMSAAAGQLATGNSANEAKARSELAQLQTQSNQLATSAQSQLPASSPARPVLAQAGHAAAAAAGHLRTMKVTPAARGRLTQAQSTLSQLAAQVGKLGSPSQKANLGGIAGSILKLGTELGAGGATG